MQLSKNYQIKGLQLNKPQWRSFLTPAQTVVNVWSRGTGKTYHQAMKMRVLAHALPRGVVAVVGRTLDQMLTNTLPGAIAALEDWGYTEWNGEHGHYVIGKRPPAHWPQPHAKRLKFDKCITWYTGTTFFLISQERQGSGRGPSFDAILADEALTLKEDHLKQEVLAANRGNLHRFKDTPYHHSVEYWTSKPYVGMGKWIDRMADYYQKEFEMDVLAQNNAAAELMLQFIDSQSKREQQELWPAIAEHLQANPYRVSSSGVYYNEAVVFDNIQNLGWKYIKQLRQSMTDYMFRVEVLNIGINAPGERFYILNQELQYDPPSYYESNGIHTMSATIEPYDLDTDVVRTEPLDIACDANASINTLIVGQQVDNEYRILNGIYVKKALTIDNAQKFCDYYEHHQKKHVRFYYDHTFIYVDAGRPTSFADQYAEVLRKNGWTVDMFYIGQAASHHSRYETINQVLTNQANTLPVAFNRIRCKDIWTALESTGIRQSNGEFKKDKRAEADTNAPQEHTTHFTDAFDTLIIGRLVHTPPAVQDPEAFNGLTIGS
jgi:hypothetical protein